MESSSLSRSSSPPGGLNKLHETIMWSTIWLCSTHGEAGESHMPHLAMDVPKWTIPICRRFSFTNFFLGRLAQGGRPTCGGGKNLLSRDGAALHC